jgi:hypothetical protein
MQVQRMHTRAGAPAPGHVGQHYGQADPRDNPLAVVETALGLLMALGIATRPASGLLAVTLVVEAVAYWQFWGWSPNIMYQLRAGEPLSACTLVFGGDGRPIHPVFNDTAARPLTFHLSRPTPPVVHHQHAPKQQLAGTTVASISSSAWRWPAARCCSRRWAAAALRWMLSPQQGRGNEAVIC